MTTIITKPGTDRPEIYGLPYRWYMPHVDSDPDPDLTITHDHENGTVLDGSSPRDGVLEIVKQHRFDWRRNVGIHIPHSRDKFADLHTIGKAAEALRAAGWKVAVEIDDVWRPAAEREGHRAERVEARVDRLDERAMRRDREGKAWREAERSIGDGMPFGEPIKKGHHSERAHRRAFDRMDDYRRKATAAHDYARHLASRADGAAANEAAKHGSRAIMRRIERLEADLRDRLRHRADAERNKAYGQLRRCALEAERLTEDIAYQKAKLADRAASGEFVAWSREHVAVGDVVNVEGRWWCQVARVNPTGVSVRQRWDWDGPDSKPTPVKWHQLFGRRRDGMQWDSPDAEPWPVEDARKVAKWAALLRSQDVGYDRSDTAAVVQRTHVAQAVRIVLGLRRDAARQEVEAYGEPDDKVAKRARALAMYGVYERLQAGEKFDDVAATVEPIGDTVPAWTMPAGEPQDVRADQLVKGDIVVGVYDHFATMTTLSRSIVGPVTRGPVVRDRRESGEWATLEVNGSEVETTSWRQFAAHLVGASRKPVEQPAEEMAVPAAEPLAAVEASGEGDGLAVLSLIGQAEQAGAEMYADGMECAAMGSGAFLRITSSVPADQYGAHDLKVRLRDAFVRGYQAAAEAPVETGIVLGAGTVTPPPAEVPVWQPEAVPAPEGDGGDDKARQRIEATRVVMHFQKFTPEQRASRAAAHTLGPRQRHKLGEHFYTHPDLPGRSFPSRKAAAAAAVKAATEVVDLEALDERSWRGSLVAVVNRLADARDEWPGFEPALEVFYRLAESAPVHEVVRMANRLRQAVVNQRREKYVPVPARVPIAELGEVWDAPVRTWTHQDVTRATVAVSVDALYLESPQGGGYECAVEWFGWQVVARGDTPGKEPVWAVFWRYSNGAGSGWRQVTGELTGRQMQQWDGIPISLGAAVPRSRPARDMAVWLDGLVAEQGDPFPEVMRASGHVPGPVEQDSTPVPEPVGGDPIPDGGVWADVLVSVGVMSGKSA